MGGEGSMIGLGWEYYSEVKQYNSEIQLYHIFWTEDFRELDTFGLGRECVFWVELGGQLISVIFM